MKHPVAIVFLDFPIRLWSSADRADRRRQIIIPIYLSYLEMLWFITHKELLAKKNLLMIAKIQFVEDVFAAAATIEIINPDFPICNIQTQRERT